MIQQSERNHPAQVRVPQHWRNLVHWSAFLPSPLPVELPVLPSLALATHPQDLRFLPARLSFFLWANHHMRKTVLSPSSRKTWITFLQNSPLRLYSMAILVLMIEHFRVVSVEMELALLVFASLQPSLLTTLAHFLSLILFEETF